ncbi:MAG: serine--tRNA ligase [Clostridiales bacterium]|nr:serine--tRNA ligase [Clostridiales bacterium]
MIDIKELRSNFNGVKAALDKRGKDYGLEAFLDIERERREIIVRADALKARQNQASKRIPRMRKDGEDVSELLAEMKVISDEAAMLGVRLREVEAAAEDFLLNVPNAPHASVPAGASDADNTELRRVGDPAAFAFEPKPHWDLGRELGIIDAEAAAKVTGARFTFYKGLGARLERSIVNFMLDTHSRKHGYTEVFPPYMAHRRSMQGTGQLPKFEEDAFKVAGTDYFLIPTAEVPVTNMHREEILDGARLPIKYCAYSACFRAEAGSAGRDTRGLIRQHQFNKVELVKFARPEDSYAELESLTGDAEDILRLLGLPYRVVCLCGGDLGFSSAKTYDIEVWMPSYNRYVEISSCSNFESFQARRAQIRYRDAGGRTALVHTLNGSGLAAGRTTAAIIENFQREDGSIRVPDALIPYMGIDEIR